MEAKPLKVLCIDGGGIKGLYSAQVLAKFEEVFNTTIAEQFDLICGTSTGGIIALAASAGISMKDVVAFYEKSGPRIFAQQWKPFVSPLLIVRQASLWSKYSNANLKKELTNVFGSKQLKESKTLLCIPAYNVTGGKPRVFKKDYGTQYNRDDCVKYVDVALATSAAPTYFPSHKIDDLVYADGGLWANNPIMVAFEEYINNFYADNRFNGLSILSISSCEYPYGEMSRLNRGFLCWKDTLFDDYSQAQSISSQRLLKIIIDKLKLNVKFERIVNDKLSGDQAKKIKLDKASTSALSLLKGFGVQTAMENKEKVETFFQTGKTITDIKSFFKVNKHG